MAEAYNPAENLLGRASPEAARAAGLPYNPDTIGGRATLDAVNGGPQDASQLIGAGNTGIALSGQAVTDANSARAATLNAAAGIGAGAGQIASGQIAVTTADAAAAASLQREYANIYGRWGTNPGGVSDLYSGLASDIQKEAIDVHTARAGIDKKLSVGFLDNPIEWLMNQITVPFELDALHSKRAGLEQDLEVLSKLREATREETTQAQATVYTLSAGRAAGMAQQALGAAKVTANQAEQAVAGTLLGVSGQLNQGALTPFNIASTTYRDLIQGTSSTIGNAATLQGMDVALQQLGLSKENLALAKDKYGNYDLKLLQIQAAHLGISEEQLRLSIDTHQYQKVIALQTAAREEEQGKLRTEIMGLQAKEASISFNAERALDKRVELINAVTGSHYGSWKELQALPDNNVKTTLLELATDPNIQQGGALSLVGPANAIDLANKLRVPLSSPGEAQLRERLNQLSSAYLSSQAQLIKTMTPEQVTIGRNNYIRTKILTDMKSIDGEGNMFSPPNLATTLQIPGISGTKLSAALLPLSMNPDGTPNKVPTDPKDVVSAAQQMIKEGKSTAPEMAKEISSFYSTLATIADMNSAYRKFALPSPLATKIYNATVPSESSSIITPYTTHNMMNSAELEMYLTRRAATQKIQEMVPAGTGP